jgi:hypothetical protein
MTDHDHTDRRNDTTPDPAETLERVLEHVPPAERHRAREALETLVEDAEDARKANEQAMLLVSELNDANIEMLAIRREREELREQVRAEQARRRDAEARLQSAKQALSIADKLVDGDYSDGRDVIGRAEMRRRYRRARKVYEEAVQGGATDE